MIDIHNAQSLENLRQLSSLLNWLDYDENMYLYFQHERTKKGAQLSSRQAPATQFEPRVSSWAFTPSDFADLDDPRSVGMALTRLLRSDLIQRIRRGVYCIPTDHPVVGRVAAGTDAITQAIARRDALKLLPSGATAANNLGLSTPGACKSCLWYRRSLACCADSR